MARSAINYLRMLQSLLPKGWAWNREEDSGLTEFLYGLSDELARVDNRSDTLLTERDTRYASELLADHENDLGLPDECTPESQTTAERRSAAHSKLIALGQQNPAYFVELADALGWTVTIEEYTPFWSGVGVSGEPCGDQEVIFHWTVTVILDGTVIPVPSTTELMCIMNKYKPAHTVVDLAFEGPEFDRGFSLAFDSMPSDNNDYLEGAFAPAFSSAFDVRFGGDFGYDDFDVSFRKPV